MVEGKGSWGNREPFLVGLLALIVFALIVAMTGMNGPLVSEQRNGLEILDWKVVAEEDMVVYHVTVQNANDHDVDELVKTVISQGSLPLVSRQDQYHEVHLEAFETKTFIFIIFQGMSGDEEFTCGF
jgi:hypothetical protein